VSFGENHAATLAMVIEQESNERPALSQVRANAQALMDAARVVDSSHSGSNFGYHGELYYRDFEKPALGHRFNVEWGGVNGLPSSWMAKTPDEVKDRIEKLAKTNFDALEKDSARLTNSAKALLEQILITLAPLHNATGLAKEKEILSQLESFDWAENAKNQFCSAAVNRFPNMSRDSEAVMQGSTLPSHIYYEGLAIQADKAGGAIEKFWKLSQRLLRQLQVQESSARPLHVSEAPTAAVSRICQRFHTIAIQLTNRRQNRPTLKIGDEYDVQDLLNALLRLYFDDVRPEESTPSFGGGAARMDFLLKREQIVVEAKMTRQDLRDKAISDELIQDVARYKQHAECKRLVCLVYDPKGSLKNPHGLVDDIQTLSSESLQVEVYVVPER
jgi:REase_DpnII-MboI